MKYITFGIIISQVEGPYFSAQSKALNIWADENNIKLLFFTGKAIHTPIYEDRVNNFTYELINTNKLDGLIVYSGSLGNFIDKTKMKVILDKWNDKPIVLINSHMENYISIISNPKEAIDQLINHIVNFHNYRNIAIVTGSPGNYDSDIRLKLFLSSLNNLGITVNEDNIYQGDFTPESGNKAANYFLNRNLPDAILCLNDDMALSIIDVFKKSGLVIPKDVAVTGFDGYLFTDHVFPALTTIRQPFTTIAEMALYYLKLLISGSKCNMETSIDCTLHIRQSCGCIVPGFEINENSFLPLKNRSISHSIIEKQVILINKCLNDDLSSSHIHHEYLSRIRSLKLSDNFDNFDKSLDMLKDLYLLNTTASAQIEYNKTYQFFMYHWIFRSVNSRISSKLYLKDILCELLNILPLLGLEFAKLYLFEEPIKFSEEIKISLKSMNLHLSYNRCGKSSFNEKGINVSIDDLYKCPKSAIMNTLYFSNEVFGIIQVGISNTPDILYENLKDVISNALHLSIMNVKIQKAQRSLEVSLAETRILNSKLRNLSIRDEMTGLLNRRGFFEMAEDLLEHTEKTGLFYILFMDMDGLKKINDNFGHDEGDRAIIHFSQAIKNSFRVNDILSRLGGDEFTAIVSCNTDNYPEIIRIRLNNELDLINKNNNKSYSISASIGFHKFSVNKSLNIFDLLKEADNALYKVKTFKKSTP